MRRSAHAAVIAAVLLAIALLATGATAERSQRGPVISALHAEISPITLPRHGQAPVSFQLSGGLSTDDGSLLPKVERLELAVPGHEALQTAGLPLCSRAQLINTKPGEAMAACGPALVGDGHIRAMILVPEQPPFEIGAQLLAFNARTASGERAVLLQAYAAQPPTSVVIPFLVRHRPGRFGTALVGNLPKALGPLPRLAGVEINLGRRYSYRGERRSYLSAGCPAAPSFTVGFFSFVRASYEFVGGGRLSTEVVRSCHAR